MKILTIDLVGYKRFRLTQTERLKIDFREKIQLILGTNGSGKSSLLEELSPLPAMHQEYHKGGYKEIVIEHNKTIYTLTSSFKGAPTHSFVKEGVGEMNPGGTMTTQRELVRKEFGITPEIHSLMIGKTKFTDMTVAQRRFWFTTLSNTDYTYAMGVFNKLKEKLRDVQGALKINQTRLIQEIKKLLSPEQEEGTRAYIAHLKTIRSELSDSLSLYVTESKTSSEEIKNGHRLITTAREDLKKLLVNRSKLLCLITNTSDNIELRTELAILEKEIEVLSASLMKKEATLNTLKQSNIVDFQNITKDILDAKDRIFKLRDSKPLKLDFHDPVMAMDALTTIEDSLLNISKEIESINIGPYNKDEYDALKNKVMLMEQEVAALDTFQIKTLNTISDLEHTMKHNETTCPKCNHTWIRGFNEKDYSSLKETLKTTVARKLKMTEELNQLKTSLNAMSEHSQLLVRYRQIISVWSILRPLWSHIDDSLILQTNPLSMFKLISDAKTSISIDIEVANIYKSISALEELSEALENNKAKDLETLEHEISEASNALFHANEKRNKVQRTLNLMAEVDRVTNSIDSLAEKLSGLINGIGRQNQSWLKQQMYIYVLDLIKQIDAEIEKENAIILQIDRQKSITESLAAQNDQYSTEIKTLKILVSELSPSEGLIAKGMQGFINVFIKDINYILEKIWLYPLELILLKSDEDDQTDLDYKFAIDVNGSDPIDDITMASTAMKEVINLSFKIGCMKYLNMMEYPIFLDEFGASMDSAHRHSAINIIKDLIQNSNYSQVFIISHYESSYGSFKNAQVNVLCPNNIILPKDMQYNTCVTFN